RRLAGRGRDTYRAGSRGRPTGDTDPRPGAGRGTVGIVRAVDRRRPVRRLPAGGTRPGAESVRRGRGTTYALPRRVGRGGAESATAGTRHPRAGARRGR